MRIENLRSEKQVDRARIMATVVWEDRERPMQDLYFETSEEFASSLLCNPHAFLVGCLLPAMRSQERRVAIDESICPELRNGLCLALELLRAWYDLPNPLPYIESRAGARPPLARSAQRAGAFLSGGVDSFAMLRMNLLDFPMDHSRSFKDCMVVCGLETWTIAGASCESVTFDRTLAALSPAVSEAQVNLIPVFTNIRDLNDDLQFWMYEFHGAALAAIAHAFASQFTSVSIASSNTVDHLEPWGSHPLLDPCYGSTDLQIRHEGARFSRLEKLRVLTDWRLALDNIRVCTENPCDFLNCGACEKCVRTMLELLVLDELRNAVAFPRRDVTQEMVDRTLTIAHLKDLLGEYSELIEPLIKCGRRDLANVILERFDQLQKHQSWAEERDWKGAIKRLDRRFLGASLHNSYRIIRNSVRRPSPQ